MTILDKHPSASGPPTSFDPCNPVCVPQICTPNPNCSPWSRAAQTDPTRTGDPCVPDTPPERLPPPQTCLPESDGDQRKSVATQETCTPDMNCDPADHWPRKPASFLWLDLTRKCQLECLHCYNSSGPDGDHGAMTREDWLSVLDQGVRGGVEMIQLIGGEPTMHPNFADLLNHALTIGLKVEVFSNLVHVKSEWWELFQRPGVSLATSYYSDNTAEHDGITGRDSHRKTRANIARAVDLGIPLRTGVIAVNPGQRADEAVIDLTGLGVTRVGTDRLRHFGRGQQEHVGGDVNELCGNCGDGIAAIGPDGIVSPCIMSGWLRAGNVKDQTLADILNGGGMARATSTIPRRTMSSDPCDPRGTCQPDEACSPGVGGSSCRPRN